MWGGVGVWRHLAVGLSVVGCAALAALGLIGGGARPERFDAKQVVVEPAGADGVRLTEVVDIDFGRHKRRGYQRVIPDDFGDPVDIVARSSTAPDDVSTSVLARGEPGCAAQWCTRIRVGNPNITITGRHRYELSYTLPEARLSGGRLALDIIGTDEQLQTERFEVVVTGMVLDDVRCHVGSAGASGGCILEADGGLYRTVISPLRPGAGITIAGTVRDRSAAVRPPPPDPPLPHPDHRSPLAGAVVALGLVGWGGTYWRSRRKGRNEVSVGDATKLVSDSRLPKLATVEFRPPEGLEPWEGAVLVRERIDDSTTAAWFSGMAGREAITLERAGGALVILPGPRIDEVEGADAQRLSTLFNGRSQVRLGRYDPNFASAWSSVRDDQGQRIAASGWWKHLAPQYGGRRRGGWWLVLVIALFAMFGLGALGVALGGFLHGVAAALVFALFVPVVTARFFYHGLLPARSATGSALAVQTESFRRFLSATEAEQVQWAWEQGLVRRYSGWAVALGVADAWSAALSRARLPLAEAAALSPLLLHELGPSLDTARTPPPPPPSASSSSDSGYSGGSDFSGGSVGGGGGGGSSGSW